MTSSYITRTLANAIFSVAIGTCQFAEAGWYSAALTLPANAHLIPCAFIVPCATCLSWARICFGGYKHQNDISGIGYT